MISIAVSVEDMAQIEDRIAQIGGPEMVSDVLDEAQALLLNRLRTRFLQQVDPDGVPWIPSQAAIDRNFNGGTLFDTGKLFHSIQAFAAEGPDERAMGTDVFYGLFHQFGTRRLPVRRFIGYSEEDEDLMFRLTLKRVKEIFG